MALDNDDLPGALDALRAQAQTLTGDTPLTTALVLPNDQIKYLTLDTGRIKPAKRREQAAAALEENTPYQAEQLSFDILAQGRQTEVAAVARETLEEAEAFATEHRFNPVCFTAIPPQGQFEASPDFGPTSVAPEFVNGATVSFDTDPIRILGKGPLPAPEAGPVPDPAPEPPQPEPKAAPEIATTPAEAPPVSFASVRARDTEQSGEAPELGGVTRSAGGTNAPSIPIEPSPTAEQNLRFDPAKVAAGLKPDAGPQPDPDKDAKASTAFQSRRDTGRKPLPAPTRSAPVAESSEQPAAPPRDKSRRKQQAAAEQQRMTVFGARSGGEVRGKPRYLGLIMTAILLVLLALVALWAAFFLDDGVAGLFRRDDSPRIVMLDPEAATVPAPEDTAPPQGSVAPEPDQIALAEDPAPASIGTLSAPITEENAPVETGLLEPANPDSITDSAEIEAMMDEVHPTAPSPHEAEARYAVTGIWERAPDAPFTPTAGRGDDLYATAIDRVVVANDAIALPDPAAFLIDRAPNRQLNPLAPGTRFDFDARGLVKASAAGTLNPDGIMVYLGRPAVLPPRLPDRSEAEGRALSRQDEIRIAAVRPRPRPGNLIEQNERASLGGRSRDELASIRPRPRPLSAKEQAEAEAGTEPTAQAVTASLRPRQRPSNIAQLAQRATPITPVVATPAAATVTPSIPTTASVARQATIKNAINLNKISLIGVYGTTSNRRALVRMANGRYKKVQVGDRIDGGKVAAIGDTELRYVKSGKNIVLKMPKG